MWKQVEKVVEDIRPLLQSVGVDATLDDVLDQVVTLELVRTDADARPDLARLREFVARELHAELPDIADVRFTGTLEEAAAAPAPAATPTWKHATPSEDADTVVLTFDAVVGPPATKVYDSASVAQEHPLAAALFGVPGVATVMARESMLIVARESGTWDELLPAIDTALEEHFGGSGPSTAADVELRQRVQQVIDQQINPSLAMHGGYIEIVDLAEGVLSIHMGGGCQGCAQSQATLRQGVEQSLRAALPSLRAVVDATDHASGSNPYFRG